MSDRNKYDAFEEIIQNKLNDTTHEHGKSWDDIANKLDASQNKKSNFSKFLLGLCVIGMIGGILYLYYNNPSSEKEILAKTKETTTKPVITGDETVVIKPTNNKSLNITPPSSTTKDEEPKSNSLDEKTETPSQNTSPTVSIIEDSLHKDSTNNYRNTITIDDTIANSDIDSLSDINNDPDSRIINNLTIISNKQFACINDSITLSIEESSVNNVIWVINDSIYSSSNSWVFNPAQSGEYLINLKQNHFSDSNAVYISVDSVKLQIYVPGLIDIEHETTEDNDVISTYFTANEIPHTNFNDQLTSDELFGSGYFHWDLGDNVISNEAFPRHQYLTNGEFLVTLTYTYLNGCIQTAQKSIEITSNFDILAPNSFTPNGDGINDTFMPEGVKISGQPFKMTIFNKQGKVIFKSENSNNGWNGFNQNTGNKCPNDNYMWIIEMVNEAGNIDNYKGTILLLN